MNDDDRKRLAELIVARRKTQYGTKFAAYKEANVNAATWDRAEAGLTIRDDRMREVVRLLWPQTGGDPAVALSRAGTWAEALDGDGMTTDPDEATAQSVMSWASENFVRINHALAEMAEAVDEISRKVDTEHGKRSAKKSPIKDVEPAVGTEMDTTDEDRPASPAT